MDYMGKFLPIGHDGMGNDFLLSLAKPCWGNIYYRDHELADGDDPDSGLELLAPSFSEFLAGLRESEHAGPDWDRAREVELEKILNEPVKPWWRFW